MKTLTVLFVVLLVGYHCQAQYTRYDVADIPEPDPIMNIGLGIGLDYGGIGGRITFLPIQPLALFGGVGYALAGFGYNIGAQFRIIPDGIVCPTLGLMYGYNGVIKIQNASQFDKIYYGPSISGGMEIHFGRKPNFMNVEIVVPFRSKDFKRDWDNLKQTPGISIQAEPLPIAISIGYHFSFK